MESQNQFKELDDRAYTEGFDDDMTVCPRPGMTAQERYEFRKNNKPSLTRSNQNELSPKDFDNLTARLSGSILTKEDHSSSTHNVIKEKALLNQLRFAQISSYCALIATGISTAIIFYGILLVLQGHSTSGTLTLIGTILATNGFLKIFTAANQRVDRFLKDS